MAKATKYALIVMTIITGMMALVPLNTSASGESATNSYRTAYYVKAGETLDTICGNFGLDSELVAAMNNMDSDTRLSQGRRIYLPREPEIKYVLKSGDTLWDIAQKYRINVNYLISYNQLSNPERLQIGQVIRIPDSNVEEPAEVKLAAEKPKLKVASRGPGVLTMPVAGVITSGFGWRKLGYHHGTDIAAPVGTPIKAVKSGVVTFSGWRPIYGYSVTIDHGDEVESVYGHASKLFVNKGQRVSQGQIIAKVGVTGRTTGPHLHLEIHIGGKAVDPMRHLQKI